MTSNGPARLDPLFDLVKQCDPEVILRVAALCNGHAILKPDALTVAGLPAEVVVRLTVTHSSDGSPKGTIYVDQRPVLSLRGVDGLDLLRFLASTLCVEYALALGRGSEASRIKAALQRYFHKE